MAAAAASFCTSIFMIVPVSIAGIAGSGMTRKVGMRSQSTAEILKKTQNFTGIDMAQVFDFP
jgi:hypothetical protein